MESFSNSSEQLRKRENLVSLLSRKGPDDLEARELLVDWIKEREAERGEDYGSEIHVLIDHALVCKDAGLLAEASELLECAYLGAHNLSDQELCAKIDGIIDSL